MHLPVRLTCLVLVSLAASAHASPLEPLWTARYTGDCARTAVFPDGYTLVAGQGRKLVQLGMTDGRPAGKGDLDDPPAPGKVPSIGWSDDHPGPKFWVGGVVMSVDGKGWVAYDEGSGTALWRRDQEAGDAGLPLAQPLAGGVLLVRPGGQARGTILELVEPRSGNVLWHVESGKEMRAWLGHDESRVYLATTPAIGARTGHLQAWWVSSGKPVYTVELSPPVNPAVTNTEAQEIQDADAELPDVLALDGGRLLLPVPGEGLRVYDAATGKETGRIAAPEVHRFGVTGLVAANGRAFFFVRSKSQGAPDGVEAVNLATGKMLWRTALDLGAWGTLHAEPTLLVETDGYLRTLDPASGAVTAEWGRAGLDLVYGGTPRAYEPSVVLCGDGKLTALDPHGKVTPPERATVDGTLLCASCAKGKRALAGVKVTIGGASAVTDKAGRFKLVVTGRGTLPVEAELPAADEGEAWGGGGARVRMSGKRAYHLGTIAYTLGGDEGD